MFPVILFWLGRLASAGCAVLHTCTHSISYSTAIGPNFARANGHFLKSKDLGAVLGDGDSVLEVGAVAAVDGDGGPTVLEDADFRAASVDHGLDGQDHARFEAGAFAGRAEVWDLSLIHI